MTDSGETPKGVVVIVSGPDGYVWAHAADFDRTAPGGCTLLEGQEARARERVALKFIAATCNSNLGDVFEPYEARQLLDRVVRKRGFHLTVVPIGHADCAADQR